MPQYYLKFRGGAAKVDQYVAMTPLCKGTTLNGIGSFISTLQTAFPQFAAPAVSLVDSSCGSCQEFLTGSPFLKHLYADGVYAVHGITYTTIMTKYDELVTPYTSGRLDAPNTTNIVVQDQCPAGWCCRASAEPSPTVVAARAFPGPLRREQVGPRRAAQPWTKPTRRVSACAMST